MKGLLLKDFYMITKYCRGILLIMLMFMTIDIVSGNPVTDFVFMMYPFIIIGMIPVTLISYDERERWNIYSLVLPYSKKEIVSSKYLTGLLVNIPTAVLYCAVYSAKMLINGEFLTEVVVSMIIMMLCAGILFPSFVLPFIFKLGAEKGRIVYLITIGAAGGLCAAITGADGSLNGTVMKLCSVSSGIIVFLLSVGLYVLSWFLSVKFYEKREL